MEEKRRKPVTVTATISMDKELKEKAEDLFYKTYGLSLSSGLSLLVGAFLSENGKIQIFK